MGAAESTRTPDLVSLEQRLRILVENVSDYAIFTLSPEGRIESWNAGAASLKGYAAEEIVGESFLRFYTPEDLAAGTPQELLRAAAADGRVECEGWRVRKDGSRFWADVVITAIRDDRGQLVGYGKVTRDLTERRAAEERLRVSEERFRLLVDGVHDYAIFMLDPAGIVTTWNAGAERIKGYTAEEIVGRHFSVFYGSDERAAERAFEELELAARVGRFEEEGWRVRKDGTPFWANVVLTALRNPDGRLVGYAKVTRDLSERRRLEEERLRRAQVEEALRLRDEFLSVASHELRTPLTALQLQLEGLHARVGDVDPRLALQLGRAIRSGERLTELVAALLDVSRIATGRLELHPEPLELAATVREVGERFATMAAGAGCELSVEAGMEIRGVWDRLRIEQVITNLLSNAMKFGAGGPITLSLTRQDDEAVLQVSDRGPGIPPEDLERIFGRFERAAPIRHFGGLGLGLYVAHQIVDGHGGSVEAANRRGGGACFTVRLPLEATRSA